MRNEESSRIFDAVFVVLLILKVAHVVNWSWLWITLPLWGILLIFVVTSIINFIFDILRAFFNLFK